MSTTTMEHVVIVHAGAGFHAPAAEPAYLAACRRACIAAREALQDGPLAAAREAVAVLEDDPCCNAGRGSNLNLDGIDDGLSPRPRRQSPLPLHQQPCWWPHLP